MKKKTRVLGLVALVAAGAMALAGCSSSSGGSSSSGATPSFNAAVNAVYNPSTKTGGTLKLLATSDCDSWDPARTYYGFCWNLQRLFSRTLIGYSKVNGNKFTLAPDMATNMGTHNADFTSWTYTLKPGLKYSDGSAITVADIKYATSRLFATDVINGGPTFYFTGLIDVPSTYAGPYKSGPYGVAVVVPALARFRPQLVIVASGFDANAYDPMGRMLLHSDSFRALVEIVMGQCDGRLAAVHEGGYSEFYVPFCGLAVVEALAGRRTAVIDPYLEDTRLMAGQELTDAQRRVIEAAATAP